MKQNRRKTVTAVLELPEMIEFLEGEHSGTDLIDGQVYNEDVIV